jgi:tetratricopeptide (TPR) repeat protein
MILPSAMMFQTRTRRLASGAVFVICSWAQQPGGAELYQAGDYERARAVLEREAANGAASPETHFWLGYTYLALAARDRAAAEFEAYLQSKPDDEDVLYALARTYAHLAEMSLQRIFQIDPASARSYQMRAIRFELESSWKEAIAQYEKAAELDPEMPGVFAAIGRIYEKELRDIAKAQIAYEVELARFPLNREANTFLSKHQDQKKPQANLEACFEKDPQACPVRPPRRKDQRAAYLLSRKEPEKALPELLAWRSQEPQRTDVYYYLGEAFTDLKVRTIQRLKQARPQSFRLHQLLGESYASTHRKAEAIQEYRRAVELSPKTPGLHYELARLIADTETEQAIEHLRTELELDPQHYMAQALLGRIYVVLQQPDNALPLLEKALAARPGLLEARKSLGQALAAQKEFAKALEQYDQVANEQQADEQIHFLRAQALQALGRTGEAAEARKRHQQVLREISEQAR